MIKNFNIFLLAIFVAFASCSFTTKTFDNNPNKEKLLMQLVSYLLEEGHFQPKNFDDDFSHDVYKRFLKRIDPNKIYFYESDLKSFSEFETKIDDQLIKFESNFFNIVYEKLMLRIDESKSIYNKILNTPFDFTIEENFESDSEKLVYAQSKKDMYERWRKQLKLTTLSNYYELINDQESKEDKKDFVFKSLDEIEIESRSLTLKNIEETSTYLDELRREDWFSVYINSIAESFDPHTYYFAPQDKDRFDASMSGKYEGIGARLQKKMNEISITELISGGSAWRQNKLQVGDIILKVRQEDESEAVSVVGMRLDDAVKLIKGPKGTNVILTLRKVDGTVEDLTITRDEIELEETYAKSSIVKKNNFNFGVINLPKFYIDFQDVDSRNATSDLKKEIDRLKLAGIHGLVLDLRNNGGGSLKTVVDIAGLFIEEGPIVQVRSSGNSIDVLADRDKSVTWDGPLVIIVNEFSASASEILAAAMQDYKRAIVIGSQNTYGKGTVQNIIDLNKMVRNNTNGEMGALKFTTQKYYRITGGSTQLKGVKSDVIIPSRYSNVEIGERDQDNPLPWDEIKSANYKPWVSKVDYQQAINLSNARLSNNLDIKLIKENAEWIKKIRSKNLYSLKYDIYKAELKLNEKESKRFELIDDYSSDLSFRSLPYEQLLIEKDSVLGTNRKRWHESLSSDIYIEESLNVLEDLVQKPQKSDLSLLEE